VKGVYNREVELQKVQIFSDYCEGQYNLGVASIIAAYVALIIAWLQYLYQNFAEMPWGLSFWGYVLLLLGSLMLLLMFWQVFDKVFSKQHNSDHELIQRLLEKIEDYEPLPSLLELKKMRKQKKR